jgi:hypothetical protein
MLASYWSKFLTISSHWFLIIFTPAEARTNYFYFHMLLPDVLSHVVTGKYSLPTIAWKLKELKE